MAISHLRQIAIAKFFDGEGPDLVAEALAAQSVPPPRAARQENLQQSLYNGFGNTSRSRSPPDAAPRIVPQPDDQVIHRPPLLLSLLFTPFSLLYKLLSLPFGFLSYLFPFLPRIFRPSPTAGTTRRTNTIGRKPLKPRDCAARLKRELEEEYGPNSLPLYDGGYAQALDLAKKELKFLVIILVSPEHDDTSSFTRNTLLTTEVSEFLNDSQNDIILWMGDVRDSEAYQVSTALRCTKFPFTALITHTPEQGSSSMSVVARITGPVLPTTYLTKLRAGIATHAEKLATVRAARSAQQFERSLRDEQNSAYERSLAQDRERARLRREAEEAAAAEEKRIADDLAAAVALRGKREQWKKWRAQAIPSEPSLDSKGVVRIALKMPQAARIMRRFSGDASVEELYAFVECYDLLQEDMEEKSTKPEDYEHRYDFRLVSTLPRVVYSIEDGGTIGEKVGKSGNLIVEPISDDEDEADE